MTRAIPPFIQEIQLKNAPWSLETEYISLERKGTTGNSIVRDSSGAFVCTVLTEQAEGIVACVNAVAAGKATTLAQRLVELELAMYRIASSAPQTEPIEEDYDDTESAYSNGMDVGAWTIAQIAVAALASKAAIGDADLVHQAILRMREARDLLVAADAPRAVERVRAALKSAEGAERNAGYRASRRQRAQSEAHAEA